MGRGLSDGPSGGASTKCLQRSRAGIRVCAAGFVLAYLAAGGVTLALGDWVAGGGWLPLRLVLLGRPLTPPWRGASIPRRRCCIPPPAGERAATTRALAARLGHTVWFYPIQVSRRWVIERTHAWATSSASGAGAPNGAEG
jgi:hypothetical protein